MKKTKRQGQGHRDRNAKRNRDASSSVREIGPLPPVVNPKRKARCGKSLRLFAETYFPQRFVMAWSADHLVAIAKLETCVLEGGLLAYAMPRGSGKTTLVEVAALWAVLYGYRRYVVPIGSTEETATGILAAIKGEIETNELLAEDFPEVCYPVEKLEGINNRAGGQTLDGERTRIEWTNDRVSFPVVAGSASAGSAIEVRGITGSIRGMKRKLPDGKQMRPDLALLDDPQTDESAHSPTQNRSRERIINGAVLGLAGPGKSIAAVMPCTVIAPGDLCDRILDTERSPRWNGERAKMLYSFPTNMARWDEYAEVRRRSFREHGDGRDATAFYRQHQFEMDAGAKPGWPERFEPGEASAIQHAMNKWIDSPRAFASEYQNTPEPDEDAPEADLTADDLAKKLSNVEAKCVPRECGRVTAFIDVGKGLLHYCVTAWDESFGGSVIEYGTWPKQNRSYYSAADARPTIQDHFKGIAEEAQIYKALTTLVEELAGREYSQTETEVPYAIERILIDSGAWTETIYQFCRRSSHTNLLLPSKGYAVGVTGKPVGEWAKRPGERAGVGWRLSPRSGKSGRLLTYDPNVWKSFVVDRLKTPFGADGCLALFGSQPHAHQLFADHLCSEYRATKSNRGKEIDVWTKRPDGGDNHWLDCLVGSAVAVSERGLIWVAEKEPGGAPKKAKRSMAAEYSAKHGGPTGNNNSTVPAPQPGKKPRRSMAAEYATKNAT
jgi:hypothetical protein